MVINVNKKQPPCSSIFVWKIVCASGVLQSGQCTDFLALVERARRAKADLAAHLPLSTLRVNLFYPNGKRIPFADVKAALRLLADKKMLSAVLKRSENGALLPARSEASTASKAPFSGRCRGLSGLVFSQAGVVAPPDGPDLGTFAVPAPSPVPC